MKNAIANIAITIIGIGLLMTGNLIVMILGAVVVVMVFGNIKD